MIISKTDNPAKFGQSYFQNVQSTHHVLGTSFEFVCGCKHNRRSFVACLIETFANFALTEEFSVAEYHQIIELICGNFPKSLISSVAGVLDSKPGKNSTQGKFVHRQLRVGLFFQLIYQFWLKEIEKIFGDDSKDVSLTVQTFRLRSQIVELRRTLSASVEQPPIGVIESVLASLSGNEISHDAFLRAVYTNALVAADVMRSPASAAMIDFGLANDDGNNNEEESNSVV